MISYQNGSIISTIFRGKVMSILATVQNIFPRKHRLISFFYGFAIGFSLIMPHSDCLSKVIWLVIYGTLFAILCMFFYFVRPKEHFIRPNGWEAVGLIAAGSLFCTLSVFDWLIYLNNPITMVVAGGDCTAGCFSIYYFITKTDNSVFRARRWTQSLLSLLIWIAGSFHKHDLGSPQRRQTIRLYSQRHTLHRANPRCVESGTDRNHDLPCGISKLLFRDAKLPFSDEKVVSVGALWYATLNM